jgi:hypothetical protein
MPGFRIPTRDSCPGEPGTGPVHTIETARKHRYILEVCEPMGEQHAGLLLYLAKCTRPNIDIDEVTIHSGQDEIVRPGKHHWKAIEFTFYEKLRGESQLTDHCAELVWRWWAETMFRLRDSVHNPASDYLKNCQLQMLDGGGDDVWTYFLFDCWPSKVSPSDLAYSDSGTIRKGYWRL